ncbi:MAG: hypothetical protein JWO67_5493 [Streptosporangiaceae bacterium]|nr:hypothetical protein [Streptosporangiaceae bacterium]
MTAVLVVMCLVVGALELYASRRARNQAEAFQHRIDELKTQVGKQSNVLVTVGEQLTAEVARVKREVLPGMDSRLRHNTLQLQEFKDLLRQADDHLRAQSTRLHELEQQKIIFSALRRKLTDVEAAVRPLLRDGAGGGGEDRVETALSRISDLERGDDQIQELQHDLTRALEDVEDAVADLLRFTADELDEKVTASLTGRPAEGVTVAGRLFSHDPQLRDILAAVYEHCVGANLLSIRFKTTDGAPERLRYFLAGRSMAELARGYAALLISIGMDLDRGLAQPDDAVALRAMLRTLNESIGATAQIGPLIVVRTPERLVCAVLRHTQGLEFDSYGVLWDPAATAEWLSRLPAHQVWDLTAWAAARPEA